MQIVGSLLRRFPYLELSTADEKQYTLRNTFLTRMALSVIGVPHLGFRMRARTILAWLKAVPAGSRILDAGSGYGIFSMLFAERGYQVDATELETERTAALKKLLPYYPAIADRISVHTESLTALSFADDTFDLAFCSEVIEHIAEDGAAARELGRVLAPGGTLMLTVPADSAVNRKIYRIFDHERPGYSREALEKLFAPAGIQITRIVYYQYALGSLVFSVYNWFSFKPLVALLFYPCYALMLLDQFLALGEPDYLIALGIKSSEG